MNTEGVAKDLLEHNKSVAREFFAALDRLDREALGQLYHPEFALDYPGNDQPLNREAHWGLITGYHQAFPDMVHRPDILTAEEDRVVVRGTIFGTHLGPLFGQQATGKKFTTQFMTMVTLRDGKVARLFSLIDTAKVQGQLELKEVLYRN